jgi:hypothetical protein
LLLICFYYIYKHWQQRNNNISSCAAAAIIMTMTMTPTNTLTLSMMAHETELIIPGSFVVLQGNFGDGMSNTMDTGPFLEDDYTDDDYEQEEEENAEAVSGSHPEEESDYQHVQAEEESSDIDDSSSSPPRERQPLHNQGVTLGQFATRPQAHLGRVGAGLVRLTTVASATTTSSSSAAAVVSRADTQTEERQDEDPYIVVTDQDETQTSQSQSRHRRRRNRQAAVAASTASVTSAADAGNGGTLQTDQLAVGTWRAACRNREVQQREEWKLANEEQTLTAFAGTSTPTSSSSSTTGRYQQDYNNNDRAGAGALWYQSEGRVAILRDIPTKLKGSGVVLRTVLGTLCAGSTIVATDVVYLNSTSLEQIHIQPTTTTTTAGAPTLHSIYPQGRLGWIQLIKIDSSFGAAYAVLSLDGYPLLTPGLPSLYVDPHVWVWRVTCPAGAYVREGLDLHSKHLDTLPYGSLVRVTRKTVNNMGLSRLRVQSIVDDYEYYNKNSSSSSGEAKSTCASATAAASANGPRVVDGWCSEFLNPLSGQRGTVAYPVPFPVPALYKVTLFHGAVIRSDVELSSSQIGHAPIGAILTIVGRAFSEHPTDKCIERLQLAGNGGWISVRLNRPPPGDDLVVELVGIDGSFEPNAPGLFHLEAQRKVRASELLDEAYQDEPAFTPTTPTRGDISSIDDSSPSSSSSASSLSGQAPIKAVRRKPPPQRRDSSTRTNGNPQHDENNRCLICLEEERNATIVHGETGHVACCLYCARILKAQGNKVRFSIQFYQYTGSSLRGIVCTRTWAISADTFLFLVKQCPVCRLPIDSVIQHFWA